MTKANLLTLLNKTPLTVKYSDSLISTGWLSYSKENEAVFLELAKELPAIRVDRDKKKFNYCVII
jgi:hypothetical protein